MLDRDIVLKRRFAMKRYLSGFSIGLLVFLLNCTAKDAVDEKIKSDFPQSFNLTVQNSTDLSRTDEAVFLNVDQLLAKAADFNPAAFTILSGGVELASQANDLDDNGVADQIVFVANFKPNETLKLQVRYATSGEKMSEFPKRTQAELSVKTGGKFVNHKYIGGTFQNIQYLHVPPEHTDHSEYIRYEGPGWESDKIGYRFYLDWRNAIDIYGKKTPDMVLQHVGLNDFERYHHMADWGMDILKVGESLGIGTIAMWYDNKANRVSKVDSVDCAIVLNGPVESLIRTNYHGWKVGNGVYQLTSELSITAGSRMTCHSLTVQGNPENLCTGIVQLPETEWITSAKDGDWAYIATFGKQSLAEDTLGMAVLYRQKDLIQMTKDEYSHVVVLKPEDGKLTYYLLGAWEQEPNGIKTKDGFVSYLNETVKKLDRPVSVRY
jgi:hypothetical protein